MTVFLLNSTSGRDREEVRLDLRTLASYHPRVRRFAGSRIAVQEFLSPSRNNFKETSFTENKTVTNGGPNFRVQLGRYRLGSGHQALTINPAAGQEAAALSIQL